MSLAALGNQPPAFPDFHRCDFNIAKELVLDDCVAAANQLQAGDVRQSCWVENGAGEVGVPFPSPFGGRRELPWAFRSGSCQISVEAAGPRLQIYSSIVPNQLRAAIGFLLTECVGDGLNSGGYLTMGLRSTFNYITLGSVRWNPQSTATFADATPSPTDQYPTGCDFLTITVSYLSSSTQALGDMDSLVPLVLAQSLKTYRNTFTPSSSAAWTSLKTFMSFLVGRVIAMKTGHYHGPWWKITSTPHQNDDSQNPEDQDDATQLGEVLRLYIGN